MEMGGNGFKIECSSFVPENQNSQTITQSGKPDSGIVSTSSQIFQNQNHLKNSVQNEKQAVDILSSKQDIPTRVFWFMGT